MFNTLPEKLSTHGADYVLSTGECTDDPDYEGWWFGRYDNTKTGLPAEACGSGNQFYLVSMCPSKEDMEEDLLRKLNEFDYILEQK